MLRIYFVGKVLKALEETMEWRHGLRAEGLDLERIIGRLAEMSGMRAEEIKTAGKSRWGGGRPECGELLGGESTGGSGTEVARRLGVKQLAVNQTPKRGARIIEERHLNSRKGRILYSYGLPPFPQRELSDERLEGIHRSPL